MAANAARGASKGSTPAAVASVTPTQTPKGDGKGNVVSGGSGTVKGKVAPKGKGLPDSSQGKVASLGFICGTGKPQWRFE